MTRKRKTEPPALRLPGDSDRMTAAIDWCEQAGVPFTRATEYQICVGPLNLYPDAGTIMRGGGEVLAAKGLLAFQAAVGEWQQKEGVVFLGKRSDSCLSMQLQES